MTPEQWIVGNDTGLSSKTIWAVMMGVEPYRSSTPIDASDFGRCHRLLKAIPAWRGRLGEVAQKYPAWGPLVAAWDELEALYEATSPTSDAGQKLYKCMRELTDEGRRAAGWIRTAAGWITPAPGKGAAEA